MGLFSRKKETPKKQWPTVIKNASISGDMICLHGEQDFCTKSTLIVQPGEEAIFVKNGVIEQVFTNGTYELTTENYPFLQRLIRLFSDGDSTFNCRVYFVRVATSVEITWGTDNPIQVRDNVLRVETKIMANGAFRVQVNDAARFLTKIVGNGMASFSTSNIKDYFRSELLSDIKSCIASVVNNSGKEVIGIAERQKEIGELVSESVRESFAEYGIELLKFSISSINVADDDLRRKYDELMINVSKHELLGDKWQAQQQAEILMEAAKNPGNGAANLGMGFAAGNAIFGMGQQMMGQQAQYQAPAPPPPPSVSSWYIYVNGQQIGPMAIAQIQQYISAGQFTRNDLVWKEGYQSWIQASNVPELAHLFAQVPPPVPPASPVPPVR